MLLLLRALVADLARITMGAGSQEGLGGGGGGEENAKAEEKYKIFH